MFHSANNNLVNNDLFYFVVIYFTYMNCLCTRIYERKMLSISFIWTSIRRKKRDFDTIHWVMSSIALYSVHHDGWSTWPGGHLENVIKRIVQIDRRKKKIWNKTFAVIVFLYSAYLSHNLMHIWLRRIVEKYVCERKFVIFHKVFSVF